MIDQVLRQKREELARKWEDREKRLEAVKLREKALEGRVRKRRRIEDSASSQRVIDEDAEWLLEDSFEGGRAGKDDALSGLSKESREILSKLGVGGYKGPEATEEEELMQEEVKVRLNRGRQRHELMKADLLHLENAFAIVTIHHGTTSTNLSLVTTAVHDHREDVVIGGSKVASAVITAKAVH
jgi:chromosome transmission fidelity protein 1